MGSEWQKYKLGELTSWSSGGTPSKSNEAFWGGDLPWISASSMDGTRYSDSKLKLTEQGLNAGSRIAPKNSILLLVRGSILHQKIRVGIAERDLSFNQDVKCLIPKIKLVDPWFLLSWFIANEKYLLAKVENTGIGAGKLDTKVMQELIVNVPPKSERHKIASFSKAIDDKIQLNRQTNQTLEQMTQALFKSWFVDFDPVIDKVLAAGNPIPNDLKDRAQRRQQQLAKPDHKPFPDDIMELFPSEFELTEELGWVPQGWRHLAFDEFCSSKQGKYIPTNEMEVQADAEYLYPIWGGNGVRGYAKEKIYSEPVVVLTCRGSNCGLIEKTYGGSWVSNISFACAPSIGSVNFLYVLFNNVDFSDCISGSAQPQITYTALKSKKVKYPVSRHLILAYSEIIDDYYERMLRNDSQSIALTKLRDTLLPKLISGELRLPPEALCGEDQKLS